MKAYDACPKCRTIDKTRKWEQGIFKKPYYFCVCQECGNIYYQTFGGQRIDNNYKAPVRSVEITPKQIDPVPYTRSPKQSPPRKQGKDTTSQARL